MKRLFSRLASLPLQYLLIIGFVLITTITVVVGSLITYRVIENYLDEAQDRRVARDMDLANAFFNSKSRDMSTMAGRIATGSCIQNNLVPAIRGDEAAIQAISDELVTELSNLPFGTQRFIVVTDAAGIGITGRVWSSEYLYEAASMKDWSSVPIVDSVLTRGQPFSAAEIIPAEVLSWLGLEDQARITLLDTPKAAPEPYDPREGTAGLVLMGASPVITEEGQRIGSVLVGHLFNQDYTLVDRIKEVAGVDTVTIFFGDLRVSTNVEDEAGNRAIGTRVSQEVYNQVLVGGQEFTGPAYVVNQWYITRYEPLYDHLQQVVGILYVGAKQAAFQRLVDSFRDQVFLIAGACVLLSILIATPLSLSISRPLRNLARATHDVAQGDWSVRVPVNGPREMQSLAQSFNTMVATLKEAQEQLIQTEKLASVGQLAAGVAHEINNPLGSVLLYADILHKETPEEDEQQRKDLQMIIREATRCKTIVNDLLNFSRQNEILTQDTDLNDMLRQLGEEQRKQGLFANVNIVMDLDPGLGSIQADPLQLHQVFINLMNNAAEAMPDGGKLVLRTQRGPSPGFATIEVQDTGVGISEENMKKIFTPFFTTKPIGKGTGLGLAIIYGIVKMHRGQISVNSKVGKGTTFTITLQEQLPAQSLPAEGSFVLQ
ncbi:MAG TPA: cache domain-containing protein [Anaerolineae bacterium]|nr:cache domain-containing protein [Anaerolineae bacterium]